MSPFDVEAARTAAHEFLTSRIDYERALHIPYNKRDLKIERMVRFLDRLGNPQDGLKIIHIAGTKGKGSTAAMIASVLTAAGYRTGLYTSPHLERVEERLRIDGAICPENEFIQLVERIQPVVAELDADAAADNPPALGPTYFDIITAMALVYFADQRVDWAVLEVGLGGRLDSTNACTPVVSVVTSISYDHQKQLGNTLAEIAREKAGIFKRSVPIVSGVVRDEPRRVIREVAASAGGKFIERGTDFDCTYHPPHHLETTGSYGTIDFVIRDSAQECKLTELELALVGEHQAANAAVALATLMELRSQGWHIDESDIRRGLATVQWPARVEVIGRRPAVILDSGHNVASIAALVETLRQSFSTERRILIFATTRDKDAAGMIELLAPQFDELILTRYQYNPRGVPAEELADIAARRSGKTSHVCPTPAEAWQKAIELAGPSDLIVITGSFFIAAEIREFCEAKPLSNQAGS